MYLFKYQRNVDQKQIQNTGDNFHHNVDCIFRRFTH